MDRRFVLLGLSAAAPALTLASMRTARAEESTIGLLDYRKNTMQYGTLSMQTSEAAMSRAQNPRVKQFAGFEFAEQLTMAQVLTDEAKPTPVALSPDNAAILQRLQQMPAGPEYDRAYVTSQLQVHQDLYATQEKFLKGVGTISADPVHVAMLARTAIQMHITMLHDLENVLRA